MFDENSTEIGKIRNFPNIENLAAEHDRVFSKFNELYDAGDKGDECEHLTVRLWEIRALIAATPSKSQSELQAKARIFEVEAARDSYFECDCSGCAQDLARSIAADVMALPVAA